MLSTANSSTAASVDLLIIGAGLSGLSLAYACSLRHPRLKILLLDKSLNAEGDRTWSFHEEDVDTFDFWATLIDHHWPHHDVHFSEPRQMASAYYTIRSSSFFKKMDQHLGPAIRRGVDVSKVTATTALSTEGQLFEASVVIDTRPFTAVNISDLERRGWGFQKFVGLELSLKEPHGLKAPLLMDARVEQKDGYRFFYLLPYSPQEILVEETYYSNDASLDIETGKTNIEFYAKEKGWNIDKILHQESGVLPLPTTSHFDLLHPQVNHLWLGAGAGFYQPVTGYSVPWAFKAADRLSRLPDLNLTAVQATLNDLRREHQETESFYLFLNKLLFWSASTNNRKNIFEHFYTLSPNIIKRLYGSKTTLLDRLRIFIGKPPIPPWDVLKALGDKPPLASTQLIRSKH